MTGSDRISASVALDVVGPFLAEILALAPVELEARLKASRRASGKVRIVIGRARRSYTQPISLAKTLSTGSWAMPPMFDPEVGVASSKPLYLVDSVLTAGELTFVNGEESESELTASIEASLVGKVEPQYLVRSKTKLTITGSRHAPFAFTCLDIRVDADGAIAGLNADISMPRAGVAGVSSLTAGAHEVLGDINELIAFDD